MPRDLILGSGERQALVTVEARVEPTGGGFPVETWAPLVKTFMQRVNMTGNETYRADQLTARYEVAFIGPYAPALDPELVDVPADHRLNARGRIYDIVSAETVGTFQQIEYHVIAHTGGD